jgi:hypothetical protein
MIPVTGFLKARGLYGVAVQEILFELLAKDGGTFIGRIHCIWQFVP